MGKIKLLLGALLLLCNSIVNGSDISYTFENIIDTSQGIYSEVKFQTINDAGEVAYVGDFSGGGSSVVVSNGITNTIIVSSITNPEYSGFNGAWINNLGQVATLALDLGNAAAANLVGDGVSLTSLSNIDGFVKALNDQGDVLLVDGGRWIGIENGGALNIIANTTEADPVNGEFSAINSGGPWINNQGEVVFYGRALTGEVYGNGGSDAIILWNGTELIPLFDNSSAINSPAGAHTGFQYPSLMINDNGAVIFAYSERPDINGTDVGLFITDGITTSLVAGQSNSSFATFIAGLNLNNNNEIAFGAILEDNTFGIYTGADPVADSVIKTGDELFNSIVSDVRIRTGGLNNNGQIVFKYVLVNGTSGIAIATPETEPTLVTIDIRPSSDLNGVNLRSKGPVTVAVLGSIDFDATQVDFTTVTFGPAGATPTHDGHVRDVNRDGFMDMVFHFKTQETGIACGDTGATLTGETFGGLSITGTDSIKTVRCEIEYLIGDTGPAGGIVFYVTDGGLHGLEAAPVDQAIPFAPGVEWGCFGDALTGADGTAIGTGQQNTADILAPAPSGCNTRPIAASVAADYAGPDGNSQGEWFLPSKDELNELYLNRGVVGGFATSDYWSSSEIGFEAWYQHLGDGDVSGGAKWRTSGVRAVRAF